MFNIAIIFYEYIFIIKLKKKYLFSCVHFFCRLATLIERCCIHLSAGYSASQGIFYPVSIAEN